uniref:BTB domain-containing protein n=1 Tax=Ciona savignyi TaxID=51511 RepID=H2YZ27_CIOSA
MAANNLNEKEYRSDHEVGLLDNVNSLREERILCDVTFNAEGGEVSAHRSILAAFSEYYRAMFTSKCKEGCTDDGVKVVGITALILNLIISFIYTAKITINSETVYQLYEAANMLQIKYVKDYCVGFLKDTLEVGNCLIVRAFAQMYNIPELVTHCD